MTGTAWRAVECYGPVCVEKLLPAKFAKIKSRQDALQTTFSVFLDIFYPPFFCHFEEWTLSTPAPDSVNYA
jgi:hypothetical protein